MYRVIYEYGGPSRFFECDDDLMDEFYSSFNDARNIKIESYLNFLSNVKFKDVKEIIDNTYTNFDSSARNVSIEELMIIYDEFDEEESFFICTRERWKENLAEILNQVAEYYKSSFCVKKITKTVIAVIDVDHEPLTDMFHVPGTTLWDDIEAFIADTQYHNEENSTDESGIKTYAEAVRYWENMSYEVVSNYNQHGNK